MKIATFGRARFRIFGSVLGVAALAAGMALSAAPVAAGTATHNSVQLSSAVPGSTGVSALVSFTTASTGTISTIDVALPNFSGLSPSVSGNSGIGAGTVASSGSGASYKVTYTVTSPASVSASTAVSFTVGNLTNPASTGNQAVVITTKTSTPSTIDTGYTLIAITTNAAATLTSTVAQAISGSVGSCTCTLDVDPSGTAYALTSTYAVSVATNAKNGVTTTVSISGDLAGTAYNASTIAAASGTFAVPTSNTGKPPVNTWGINADGTSNNWAGPTTSGIAASGLTTAGPTNAISQSHVVGLNVDFTTPADTYTTTIRYVFTPNF